MEEAPLEEEDEVFYIFYEDKKPEASYEAPTYQSPPTQVNTAYSVQALRLTKYWHHILSKELNIFYFFLFQNDISSYIVEDVQASKAPQGYNQFNAPNPNDIRTVYVPFESAVNIPNTYDVR